MSGNVNGSSSGNGNGNGSSNDVWTVEDGYSNGGVPYYWNSNTGASAWEAPASGWLQLVRCVALGLLVVCVCVCVCVFVPLCLCFALAF